MYMMRWPSFSHTGKLAPCGVKKGELNDRVSRLTMYSTRLIESTIRRPSGENDAVLGPRRFAGIRYLGGGLSSLSMYTPGGPSVLRARRRKSTPCPSGVHASGQSMSLLNGGSTGSLGEVVFGP